MAVLTITAKGQVTLRKELLKHLGVRPGDQVRVDALPDGRIEVAALRSTGKISDIFGIFKRDGGPVLTIEEIKRATEDAWAGLRDEDNR